MDNTLRQLERKSHSDPQLRQRYEQALNRLIAGGDTDTLYAYHQSRLETQVERKPTLSERDLNTFVNGWDATLEYQVTQMGLCLENRLNPNNEPHMFCQWQDCYSGRNCAERNDGYYCHGCSVNERQMRATVRLILAREPVEPTYVEFDENNPAHSAAGRNWYDSCSCCDKCYAFYPGEHKPIRIWSERQGHYVYRDPDHDWWDAKGTLEYQTFQNRQRKYYLENDSEYWD